MLHPTLPARSTRKELTHEHCHIGPHCRDDPPRRGVTGPRPCHVRRVCGAGLARAGHRSRRSANQAARARCRASRPYRSREPRRHGRRWNRGIAPATGGSPVRHPVRECRHGEPEPGHEHRRCLGPGVHPRHAHERAWRDADRRRVAGPSAGGRTDRRHVVGAGERRQQHPGRTRCLPRQQGGPEPGTCEATPPATPASPAPCC